MTETGYEFVRRLSSAGDLTYHVSTCRHVRGREDAEGVDLAEVQSAAEAPRFQRVNFRGRVVCLNVCGVCFPPSRFPKWPPR